MILNASYGFKKQPQKRNKCNDSAVNQHLHENVVRIRRTGFLFCAFFPVAKPCQNERMKINNVVDFFGQKFLVERLFIGPGNGAFQESFKAFFEDKISCRKIFFCVGKPFEQENLVQLYSLPDAIVVDFYFDWIKIAAFYVWQNSDKYAFSVSLLVTFFAICLLCQFWRFQDPRQHNCEKHYFRQDKKSLPE